LAKHRSVDSLAKHRSVGNEGSSAEAHGSR
jgi:hypothetical protein